MILRKDVEVEHLIYEVGWLVYGCNRLYDRSVTSYSAGKTLAFTYINLDTSHHETQLPYITHMLKVNIEHIFNQKMCNINIYRHIDK